MGRYLSEAKTPQNLRSSLQELSLEALGDRIDGKKPLLELPREVGEIDNFSCDIMADHMGAAKLVSVVRSVSTCLWGSSHKTTCFKITIMIAVSYLLLMHINDLTHHAMLYFTFV
jgi:hypothetical protein